MIHVLKIGGGAGVDYRAVLENLAERIRLGERWIVVHGASDATNQLAEQHHYAPQFLTSPSGHISRYCDARTMEIYAKAVQVVNDQMRSVLEGQGVAALGLVGDRVISGRRKQAIRAIRNGRQVVVRDDYSGRITGVDSETINQQIEQGIVPVVAPLATGEEGENLNVDGDLVAATIAHGINATSLVILTNVPGLLRDVSDGASLIREIPWQDLEFYQSFAHGRMKMKLLAATQAEVGRTILASSCVDRPLDAALDGGGTHIYQDRELHYA